MTPEDELLFACIRQDFSEAQQETIRVLCKKHTVRWEVVYSTAELHGVAPLVCANLKQCLSKDFEIPREILDQFEHDYYYNLIAKEKIAQRTGEVLAFLNQQGIDTMLVKGGALDILVYAHPWYTTANDVDLIFRTRRAEMPSAAVPRFLDRFQDIHFEYDYFEHHDITMNGILPVEFETIWRDATKIDFRGHDVWVMSPEDLLIAACINSCRKRFFRLKALRDISEISNHYGGIKWEELGTKARAYQCNTIVYGALVVTQMIMGIELPAQAFDGLAVPVVRAALIRYLSRKMSFVSLATLYEGSTLFSREVGRGLLLPYATYRRDQMWKRIKFVSDPQSKRKARFR